MKLARRDAVALTAVTIVGGLLRLWSPGRIALWGDEVQFINIATLPTLLDIIRFLANHESHPPLLYALAHLIDGPPSRVATVMSSWTLLASTAAIPVTAWVAGLSGWRSARVVAALLVALSMPLIFLSVQLRPYAFVSLLLLCSVGAIIRGMGHSGNRWRAVWAISALLLLYLHHIAVLIVAMEVILALALSVRHVGPRVGLSRWLPWIFAVAALAIPDLLLLRHQEALTGYLPAAAASVILPVRQFLRVTISFPGELLVPIFLAFVLLPWSVVWWRRRRHVGADVDVVGGLHGAMVLVSFLLIAAAYRQSILVDHVLLSLAPLGMALVAAALGHLLAHGRRVLAVVLLQAAVAGATLSALATVGAVKTNIDLVAHAIAADAKGDDLVVLAAGAPGASFNWYLERQLSQIDFPVIGPVARYRFDRGFERLADTTALRLATDSIVATAAGLRRLWFVYPANWDVTSPAPRVLPNSMPGIEARRSRAALLHHIVMGCFGAPVAQFSGLDTPWGMEIMSFQLFAAQPDQREHLGTDCQRG